MTSTDAIMELRWYTALNAKLNKWISRGIFLGGNGELWTHATAYELILQAKDFIGNLKY